MKFSKYCQILRAVEDFNNDGDFAEKLAVLFPKINNFTLRSIYAQWMQKRVKKNFHTIMDPEQVQEYYNYYCKEVENGEPPGIILRLAKNLLFSPALLAKAFLEHQLNIVAKKEGILNGVTKSQVNKLLRDTTQIQDKELSYEVYLCLVQDDMYGPFADSIKHSLGHEYEFLLRRKLEKLGISFQDENVLRNRGYDKTPDIKLDNPIAVDGHVINWIESKASFGDEENHKKNLRDQFWSYWNRFGPGLVIYWFGFIEELDEHSEKGIIIRERLPEQITFMDPLAGT